MKDVRWTTKDLAKSKVAKINKHIIEVVNKPKKTATKSTPKFSKEKYFIETNLQLLEKQYNLELSKEFRFHPIRKWRFDWAFVAVKLGIEYNGIMSAKSRHTTIGGFSEDMNKINAAQLQGFTVLQYTPLNYKQCVCDVDQYLKLKTPT